MDDHGISAVAIESAELLHYCLALRTGKHLLVVVSQSGESIEPVRLMESLESPVFVISLTNGLQNTIARMSQLPLDAKVAGCLPYLEQAGLIASPASDETRSFVARLIGGPS